MVGVGFPLLAAEPRGKQVRLPFGKLLSILGGYLLADTYLVRPCSDLHPGQSPSFTSVVLANEDVFKYGFGWRKVRRSANAGYPNTSDNQQIQKRKPSPQVHREISWQKVVYPNEQRSDFFTL